MGFIGPDALEALAEGMRANGYGRYLLEVLAEDKDPARQPALTVRSPG